jgi:heterotetrameric sarcosine oxidase delta subunit
LRIPCSFCGPRGNEEFTYLGDATVRRPDPAAPNAMQAFHDYVYRTHEISDVKFALRGGEA